MDLAPSVAVPDEKVVEISGLMKSRIPYNIASEEEDEEDEVNMELLWVLRQKREISFSVISLILFLSIYNKFLFIKPCKCVSMHAIEGIGPARAKTILHERASHLFDDLQDAVERTQIPEHVLNRLTFWLSISKLITQLSLPPELFLISS